MTRRAYVLVAGLLLVSAGQAGCGLASFVDCCFGQCCDPAVVGCTTDADCAVGQTCDLNTPNANGSPGACVAAGAGEGEGEAACDKSALADNPAGDVAVTGCVLERQGEAGSAGCSGGSPFVVRCDVTGATGGANVAVSVDGGAPESCVNAPGIANGAVACELCLELAPSGLALELTVDGADSGAVCADVSKAS